MIVSIPVCHGNSKAIASDIKRCQRLLLLEKIASFPVVVEHKKEAAGKDAN
jgi:hypothetical protein